MKKIISLFLLLSLPVVSAPTNVALNANVSLQGGSFFTGGWGGGITVSPQTVVDGVFLPEQWQWDQGGVWWDDTDGGSRYIVMDLNCTASIDKFIAQVDDNDAYELYFRDLSDSSWQKVWDIPNYDQVGWGLLTRPVPGDYAAMYELASPIVTNALMIKGNLYSSDRLFSVSEVQAWGTVVPAPGALLLTSTGLILVNWLRNRRAL